MESDVLPLVGFVIVVFLLMLFLGKKKLTQKHQQVKSVPETGIPHGMENLYHYGVDPCSAGMPVMYTLHTCRHCVRLKDFLVQHGIEHRLVFVDDFEAQARKEIMATLRTYNARASFPTLVMPDGRSVAGFREKAVKELLDLDE